MAQWWFIIGPALLRHSAVRDMSGPSRQFTSAGLYNTSVLVPAMSCNELLSQINIVGNHRYTRMGLALEDYENTATSDSRRDGYKHGVADRHLGRQMGW